MDNKKITITINDKDYQVDADQTITVLVEPHAAFPALLPVEQRLPTPTGRNAPTPRSVCSSA